MNQGRAVTSGTDARSIDPTCEVETLEAEGYGMAPLGLSRDDRSARSRRRRPTEREGHPGNAGRVATHPASLVRDPPKVGPGRIAMRLKRCFDLLVAGIVCVPAVSLGALIAI